MQCMNIHCARSTTQPTKHDQQPTTHDQQPTTHAQPTTHDQNNTQRTHNQQRTTKTTHNARTTNNAQPTTHNARPTTNNTQPTTHKQQRTHNPQRTNNNTTNNNTTNAQNQRTKPTTHNACIFNNKQNKTNRLCVFVCVRLFVLRAKDVVHVCFASFRFCLCCTCTVVHLSSCFFFYCNVELASTFIYTSGLSWTVSITQEPTRLHETCNDSSKVVAVYLLVVCAFKEIICLCTEQHACNI